MNSSTRVRVLLASAVAAAVIGGTGVVIGFDDVPTNPPSASAPTVPDNGSDGTSGSDEDSKDKATDKAEKTARQAAKVIQAAIKGKALVAERVNASDRTPAPRLGSSGPVSQPSTPSTNEPTTGGTSGGPATGGSTGEPTPTPTDPTTEGTTGGTGGPTEEPPTEPPFTGTEYFIDADNYQACAPDLESITACAATGDLYSVNNTLLVASDSEDWGELVTMGGNVRVHVSGGPLAGDYVLTGRTFGDWRQGATPTGQEAGVAIFNPSSPGLVLIKGLGRI